MPTPYSGREFTFTNPDGSELRVRGFGNQFVAVFETLDGFTVVKDPRTGFYRYATVSADGARLLPTGPVAGTVDPATLDLAPHARPAEEAARDLRQAAAQAGGAPEPATAVTPRWRQRNAQRKRRAVSRREEESDDPDRGPDPLAAMAGPVGAGPEPAAAKGVVGSYVGLCLLIRFPDVPDEIERAQVQRFCNDPGYAEFGNNGSVRDYFHDVSAGRLTYTNAVTKYVTAKRPRAYYADPTVEFGKRAQTLIREGLDRIKARGFDFNRLSADADGYVRALNVFYVGQTVNDWAEGLWPHSSALAKPYVAAPGRTFSDYQITNMGSELTLRVFCHENGHMICDFPDLYDYGYESSGVGDYCLMGFGGSDTNPVQVCAYLKRQAGWATKVTATPTAASAQVVAGTNAFLIHKRNSTEYFLVENRQRTGRDASLPDNGLAIWHVDETGSNDFEAMTKGEHYECALEQADGRFDLERGMGGDSGDLFAGPKHKTFGAVTLPNSRWWNGSVSGLEIVDVSANGATMTLKTGKPPQVSLANLKYGVKASADVKALQVALNAHFPALKLPTTGNYLTATDAAVRKCQKAHGFGSDPAKKSFVGKQQAAHLGLRI